MDKPDFYELERKTYYRAASWDTAWNFMVRDVREEYHEEFWKSVTGLIWVNPVTTVRALVQILNPECRR
jgi:hypothetical protein